MEVLEIVKTFMPTFPSCFKSMCLFYFADDDPCTSGLCLNGGTCVIDQLSDSSSNLFHCACAVNFAGELCSDFKSGKWDLLLMARYGWNNHCWWKHTFSIQVVKFITFQSSQGQFLGPYQFNISVLLPLLLNSVSSFFNPQSLSLLPSFLPSIIPFFHLSIYPSIHL